ncbi:MAG: C1 family peptidase, partial [Candidatus Hydrogenedentes bacterium]|nr:C1 family peptidase [Candidatus Hydrogenedentota bacterium]
MSLQGGKTTTYTAVYEPFSDAGGLAQTELDQLAAQASIYGWTFTMSFNSATDRALDAITGDVDAERPTGARKSMFVEGEKADAATLPAAFDWRTQGGVTPVKNVQGCAASWAFATNAVTESVIKILDKDTADLSEEYLVSANANGWTCATGGNRAFGFYSVDETQCSQIGAVLEKDFPYRSADAQLNCPYNPQYRLRTWGYVAGEFPTESQIKEAITTYGPVYVSVTADRAFQAYTGGVYNNDANGTTNLAAVLVGWDDAQGTAGVWILRNAWGNGWGEDDGYMRIEYGCSSVGRWAAFAQYTGQRAPVLESFTINDGAVMTHSRTVTLDPVWTGTRPSSYLASEHANFSDTDWTA